MKSPQQKKQPAKSAQPSKKKEKVPALIDRYPWVEYALVAAIIAILFFIRSNFVGIPMERDEGSYAMLGQWLINGAKPYVDFYEQKPPGLFLAYGLIVKIFGYDYMRLQWGFCFVYALILVFSYLFFRSFAEKRAALALLPVFGLALLNSHISGFTIQSEFLVLLFIMAGLYVFSAGRKKQSYLLMFVAGILLGFAVMIKQVGIFYCIFGALWLVADWWKERATKKTLFELGAYALGGILSVSSIFLWLKMRGVLDQAIFWFVEFPRKYYLTNLSFDTGMKYLQLFSTNIMKEQPLFWVIAFAGLIVGVFLKIPKERKILYYIFVLLAFCCVVPGFRFMTHYWIVFMPGLALAILMGYQWLIQVFPNAVKNLLWVLFAIIPISNLVASSGYYLHPNFDDMLHAAYSSNPFPEMKVVGDLLNEKMKPGDQLFVAGSEPELYLYTKNLGVSRHNFIGFFTLKSPYAKKWQDEAIADVEKKMPKYVVSVMHPLSWMLNPDGEMTFFNWTQKWIPEHYNLIFMADQANPGGQSVYVDFTQNPNYQKQGHDFVAVWQKKEDTAGQIKPN